jgi:hypothetical protein
MREERRDIWFLASQLLLGMRRAGVTETCILLRDKGCIDYSRGQIQIASREGLEDIACGCYEIVKKEFDRLFGENPF